MSGTPRTEISVLDSDLRAEAEVLGVPEAWEQGTYPDFVRGTMYVRSCIHKEAGALRHQLIVESSYFREDWISWHSANDDRAGPLEFTPIEHRVDQGGSLTGNCAFTEAFGLTLSDDYLSERRDGFQVRVHGRTGPDVVLSVTSQMIASQHQAIAELISSLS